MHGRERALVRALLLLAACSTLQASLGLLLVSNSASATEARVRHLLASVGIQEASEVISANDYLGLNAERRGDWVAATHYFSASSELAPSQSRLARVGRSAAFAEDWELSRTSFSEMLARDSSSTIGWCGYAATSAELGDSLAARAANQRLLELCRLQRRRSVALRFLAYAAVLDSSGRLRAILLNAR